VRRCGNSLHGFAESRKAARSLKLFVHAHGRAEQKWLSDRYLFADGALTQKAAALTALLALVGKPWIDELKLRLA
jgi:hypothetical protein